MRGFLEGYKRGKANVDLELLARHSEGVIALTGCLQSRFCRRLVDDNPAEARAHADDLVQIFGPEDVYFELQNNGIADQDKANEGIARIAREMGGRSSAPPTSTTCAARTTTTTPRCCACRPSRRSPQPKMSFDTNEFYLKDTDEMAAAFAPWPEAVPTTLEIAERCNVEIELGSRLIPSYPTPDGSDEDAYLRELAMEGLRARYGDPLPGRGGRAARDGARRDREDGLRGLLPDRLGLRQVREGQRDRRRPGPRLGGRLDRLLRAAHHRRRPARATTCCSSAS